MNEYEYGTSSDMFAMGAGLWVVIILLWVFAIVCLWKLFEKADKPGWAAIVPIYNIIVLLEIVGRPLWWIVLMLIPCVNIVVSIMVQIDLAKKFGKDVGFGIGLILLPIVFLPILAFGDAEYQG